MTELARKRYAQEGPRLSAIAPLRLLETALKRDADEQVLAQLIDLHERTREGEARRAFEAALAAAKAEIPVIIKTQQASLGRTSYRHEDLAEIARTIGPILARHGLAYRFRSLTSGSEVTITCIVSHRDGYREENSLSAGADTSGEKNPIQAIGSTLTYLQRMSLKAALGLAAAHDDDGRAASAPRTINRQQVRELLSLIREVGADKEALLQFFKIKAFAELPERCFRQALVMLNARKGRA